MAQVAFLAPAGASLRFYADAAGAAQEMPWRFLSVLQTAVPHNVDMDGKATKTTGKAAKRWFVSGDVQGVGFRFFVQDKATSLGLFGWARNLSDGRVEVYATGPASRLSDLAAALHIGPRTARVRSVEERDEKAENLSSFAIR